MAATLYTAAYAQSPVNSENWQGVQTGHCFASIGDFLTRTYGAEHETDENIQLTALPGAADRYVWVLDKTPQVNITRTLLERRQGNKICVVLHAPLASSLSLEITRQGHLPKEAVSLDTPPPDFSGRKVVYAYSPASRTYQPSQCFVLPKKGKAVKVSCRKLYD